MGQAASGTLQSYFEHIHDGTIELSWIFRKIEGSELTDTNIVGHHELEDVFYNKYIIAIVKDCTTVMDCDVLLAIYGLMDGYTELEIGERRNKYCQEVGIYSKRDKKYLPLFEYWSDIKGSMTNREDTAIKHLLKELERKIGKGNKPTPYINAAYKHINKPCPIPNYLLGRGYQKCEIDGNIFYVPLSSKERRSLANISVEMNMPTSPDTKSNSSILSENSIVEDEQDMVSDTDTAEAKMSEDFQSEDVHPKFSSTDNLDSAKNNELNVSSDKDDIGNSLEDGISPTITDKGEQSKQSENKAFKNSQIENTVPESGQTEKRAKEDKILQEKGESIEKIRKKSPTEPTSSTDKAIRFAGSLIAGSIIASAIINSIVEPITIEKANAYKEVMSSVIPAENPSLAEDIPVVEAMLIEAESFKVKDIDEENRIEVVPDITKKLTIELEPQDADMSTLKFESSSPDIVNAEYGYVTAYGDNMTAGKSYVIDITITAIKTDYSEVIHVAVESSKTPDDVDGAVFGGSQK